MPLVNQPLQDAAASAAAVFLGGPVHTIPASQLLTLRNGLWQPRLHLDPAADSPPDLVILTASFLI